MAEPERSAAQQAAPRSLAPRHAVLPAFGALAGALLAVAAYGGWLHLDRALVESELGHARDRVVEAAIGSDLRSHAVHAANAVDAFLAERIVDARQIAATPRVVDAVREGGRRHAATALDLIPIEEAEAVAGPAHSRRYFPDVDAFLDHVRLSNQYFAEVFVTDLHGFIVAYSNPTSDFVQSDEEWWTAAWSSGAWIGEVEYDRSAAALSLDLAIRIDAPDGSEPLGVLKGVVNLGAIQDLMTLAAEGARGIELSAFDAAGRPVAETASGHTSDRILSDAVKPPEVDAHRSGWIAGEASPIGYARTGGPGRYQTVGTRFGGLGWLVTATLDAEALAARREHLGPLVQHVARTARWPNVAIAGGAGGAVLGALFALVLGLVAARRTDRDLADLAEVLSDTLAGRSPRPFRPKTRALAPLGEPVQALVRRAMGGDAGANSGGTS